MSEIWDPIIYAVGVATALVIYLPFSPMTIDLLMLPRARQIAIYRHRKTLWAVVAVCCALLAGRGLLGLAEPAWLWAAAITAAVLAMGFWGGYVPFVMTPPSRQRLLSATEADQLIAADEVVLGLVEGGEARAYPRDALARPHYFTETVGGTPFIISYCILCNSGMAFRAELDGQPMNLRCATAFNNNIIYHDPDTGNFIQQLDGAVFEGPDAGKRLDAHPVVQASWGEWKRLHPETKLYYAPANTLRDKMVATMLRMMMPVEKLARRRKPWHRVSGELDPRLPAMSFVFGVEVGGETCAYPLDLLRQRGVVEDEVGGTPIVVLYDRGRDLGQVFSRRLGARTLSFTAADDDAGGALARDLETGSLWELSGGAREGELAGQSLTALPHYNKLFWFSWALFKPGTRLAAA